LEVVLTKAAQAQIPVFDVIRPAARYALQVSPMKRIGVIGTKTTIQSHVYLRTLLELAPDALVIEKATPLLVPMIEEGWVNSQISLDIVDAYMSDTGFAHLDSLILGCTHYPLIKEEIQGYFNKSRPRPVEVVDSSVAVAEEVKNNLDALGLLNPSKTIPQHRFVVSDLTPNFQSTAAQFLGREVELEVV
jgi:glutamate racemase